MRPLDVILPVAGAAEDFRRCVDSLLDVGGLFGHRLVVVLDGPQDEAVLAVVARLRSAPDLALEVLENPVRRGYPTSVNRGMALSERDVVLLNSDTIVTAGWLGKLQAAAASAPRIATVTPFSNNATICSLPEWLVDNELPTGHSAASFGRLVEAVSQRSYPRLPTGVGFCLYIRREALDEVGLFDDATFGLGYGEEVDFCRRALQRGFVHLLDDATFIYHAGQRSFGKHLERRVRRSHRVLARRHPSYLPDLACFLAADPLVSLRQRVLSALGGAGAPGARPTPSALGVRRALAAVRAEGFASLGRRLAEHAAYQLARRGFLPALALAGVAPPELGTSVLHVHGFAPKPWFGGVQVELAERRREESRRAPFALLFPDRGHWRLEVWRGSTRRAFRAGEAFGPAVRAALTFLGSERLHVENLAGLPLAELAELARAGLPLLIAVHDLEAFRGGAEPAAELLRAAEQVIYPSCFLKEAIAALCPGLAPERQQIRLPLTGRFAGLRPRLEGPFQAPAPERPLRIAFVGTVAPHKGSWVLAAVLDGLGESERRRFAVSAYGGGSPAELEALRCRGVRLRGFYRPATLTRHLRADGIDLALLLSPVPESYGITLDECLAAGVRVLAFDHGAIPERLRAADGGWLVQPERGAEGVREVLRGLSASGAYSRHSSR